MNEFTKPTMTFGDQLRFSPYAWAKLLWMRDRGATEVAGYGITATGDPLLVTDFILVKQKCTEVSFDLDPEDGAKHTERMMDQGIPPWACMNLLIHTHPGNCPSPSLADEENFIASFSHPDWAIMFIIADGGDTYCRIKVNVGPGIVKEIKVAIDWKQPFCGTDIQAWEKEYKENVTRLKFRMTGSKVVRLPSATDPNMNDPLWRQEGDNLGELMEAQQKVIDDLREADGEDLYENDLECCWDNNGDVVYYDDQEALYYNYNPESRQWYEENTIGGDDPLPIDTPKEPWVDEVINWAKKHDQERQLILEN